MTRRAPWPDCCWRPWEPQEGDVVEIRPNAECRMGHAEHMRFLPGERRLGRVHIVETDWNEQAPDDHSLELDCHHYYLHDVDEIPGRWLKVDEFFAASELVLVQREP